MALSGQLKDFNLLQLLALVQKTGKSGSLVLKHWDQSATIYFQDGKLVKVKNSSRTLPLVLLQSGKIDQERFELMSTDLSEKAIALLLSDDGILSRQEAENLVREKMEDDLLPLLIWTDGTFSMELGAIPSEGDILTPTELGPVLRKARAHMDDWPKLLEVVPSLDASLRLASDPAKPSGQLCLSVEEWRVVAALATEVPLNQLARRLELDELGVRKVVGRLIGSGLAALSEPVPASAWPPPPSEVTAEKERLSEPPKVGSLPGCSSTDRARGIRRQS